MTKSKDVLEHVSEVPWSNYSEADYTLEQWHRACLIHLHDGPPTSKTQCKLPVRTPSGAININGMHAAAAALAGARTPIKASPEQKSAAATMLVRMYKQMGGQPPPSMMSMMQSATQTAGEKILEHFGVKGMRWGVRKDRGGRPSGDSKKVSELRKRPVHQLTNKQLKTVNERLNLEQNFHRMNPHTMTRGIVAVTALLGATGLGLRAYDQLHSPGGKALISAGKKFFLKSGANALKIAKPRTFT